MLQCDDQFAIVSPPSFEMPDELTLEEVKKIEILAAEHLKLVSCYKEKEQVIIYRHGFLDALEAAAFVDREE